MIKPMDYHAEATAILATGTPRSEPYRLGLCRILEVRHRKATGQPPLPPLSESLPYPVGSAEADAFFAGCERGRHEWNARYACHCNGQQNQAERVKETDQ